MTRRAIAAAATAVALASVSVLATAIPANAATTIDNVTFYGSSDFGQESAGYPAGFDWFFGEVSGTEGSAEFTPFGIEFNGAADGKVQILNQDVETPATATELADILDDIDLASTSDDWTFQLPFFAEGASGFTTLRPGTTGSTFTAQAWITSQAIAATTTTPAYVAGASAPLADLAAALYGDAAPTLLAYGFFVNPGDEPIIQGINWDGAISSFTAVYTQTVGPTTISTGDLGDPAKGISLALTGAVPGFTGNSVYIRLRDSEGEDVFSDFTHFVAPDGTFSHTLVIPNVAPGNYVLTFDDNSYGYQFLHLGVQYDITVIAALAATGVDATVPAGIALGTLLGGSLLVFASRRRSERA